MQIQVDYDPFVKTLGVVKSVLNDKAIKEEARKIILKLDPSEGQVKVMAFTVGATCKAALDCEILSEEGGDTIQLKSAELDKILSAFANMSSTRASKVEFETLPNSRVRVIVHEEPLDEEHTELANSSVFYKVNLDVREQHLAEIEKEFPEEEADSLESKDLAIFLSTLLPIMSSDMGQQTAGTLNFDAEYVYVFASTVGMMANTLPDSLKGVALTFNSVQLLNRILSENDSVEVVLNGPYVSVLAGSYQANLRHQRVREGRLSKILQSDSTDRGVVVNRPYLRDVLKRAEISDNKVSLLVKSEDELEISAEGFNQVIPLEQCKPEAVGEGFKVAIKFLFDSILGDDGVFDKVLFMYLVPDKRMTRVTFSDSTGIWKSTFGAEKLKVSPKEDK